MPETSDRTNPFERSADPTVEFRGPEQTAALPTIPAAVTHPALVTLTFVAVAAAAFLVGIAVASGVRPSPSGEVVSSQRVGPAGGTIRFEGGELRIPQGALASPMRVVVRRSVVAERVQVRPPESSALLFAPGELVAHSFEPTDRTFERPVTIMFRLQKKASNGSVFARLAETTLLLGGDFDPDRQTVTIEVRDFRFTRGQPAGATP